MKKQLSLTIAVLMCLHLFAQTTDVIINVQPYLQDATPHSIIIKWQTNSASESYVDWGSTHKLGNSTKGISEGINYTDTRIHEVKLTELKRFTTYYYRVRTGNTSSDIFQFKTSPFAMDNKSFQIVAMSDMQYDVNNPDKYKEIVEDGILKYLKKESGGQLSDKLALIMIPGDLVENGTKFMQWETQFFKPSEKLFAHVPVYPVLGNHERNSDFYFKYFSLPENGNPAYSEHWWSKDYGNTRIIGLNSNDGYRDLKSQYLWLEKLLKDTEKNSNIDFVFAQLHHPHKSELWIPGEEEFSGKIVKLLEKFTSDSGKPSVHFFGHTHGYSRGQSKNHKHLWVNVASAGGAIDNWGEFEGRDYDEFTVSQDEYGFVMVSVDGNREDPAFTLKRISRGNGEKSRDNELRDSITIYKNNRKPSPPSSLSPTTSEINITGTILKASPFQSTFKNAFHAASNWQVATTKDFSKLVFDSWKQYQNWYYKENRQQNDDLTDENLSRLSSQTTYYWRVRYRDQYLNWSDWSNTLSFKTK